MTKYSILILSLMLSLFLINQANATIWYVYPDSTLNTIQAGLDSASAGDTVLVGPGTYNETIIWPSTPQIKLISEFGPEVTVIDADGSGRVMTLAQYLTGVTVIDGFTIMNGWATGASPDTYGGGIYCLNTSPTIRNNIIRNNSGYSRGGGIYCQSSSPQIVGNIIWENGTSGRGGGISCYNGADASIRENYFYNNSAASGGAIACYIYSDASIQYNQILDNNAGSGGGVYAGWGTNMYGNESCPTIHYNNISGNAAYGIYWSNFYCWSRAQNNWWGHAAGPDSGDAVRGKVDYDPWLTDEIVFDIAVISVEAPPDTVIPGALYTPKIIVKNNCNYNYPVSFFTAKCTVNGYQDYVRIHRSIPQDSTVEVTFADWTVPLEDSTTYAMSVRLSYAIDQVVTDDTISKQIIAQGPTGIEDTEVLSSSLSFALFQNHPNPFNPLTQIEYMLSRNSQVELCVHNILGQKVRTLVKGHQAAGHYRVHWDGTDHSGNRVASSVYFCRIQAGEFKDTKKMILMK